MERNNLYHIYKIGLIKILQGVTPFVLLLALEQFGTVDKFLLWHRFGLVISTFGIFDFGLANIILIGTGNWENTKHELLRMILIRSLIGVFIVFLVAKYWFNWSINSSAFLTFAACFIFISRYINIIQIGLSKYNLVIFYLIFGTVVKLLVLKHSESPVIFIGVMDMLYSAYYFIYFSNSKSFFRKQITNFKNGLLFWIVLSSSASLLLGFAEKFFIEKGFNSEMFVHLSFVITFFSVFSISSSVFSTLILKGVNVDTYISEISYYIFSLIIFLLVIFYGFPIIGEFFPYQMQGYSIKTASNLGMYYFFIASLSPVHARCTSIGKLSLHVVITLFVTVLFFLTSFLSLSFFDNLFLVGLCYSSIYFLYDYNIHRRKTSLIFVLFNLLVYAFINHCTN